LVDDPHAIIPPPGEKGEEREGMEAFPAIPASAAERWVLLQ